ncbi:MAG: heparinase II/III family protein [Phycisphaerae bacterium]|nr:heparinase II/III family protein [Phycisphaerae bacterium]
MRFLLSTMLLGLTGVASAEPGTSTRASLQLGKRQHPFLFANAETFARAKARAEEHPWAKKQMQSVIASADGILKSKLTVPNEPGQWSHHYVCKKCGAGLKHSGDKHVCKRCKETYTGWPYDQVVCARIHSGNWSSLRTLGLAYAFTGNEAYAQRAREVLLAYADKYDSYPLHNVWGKLSRSAGRVFAQTLDEAVAAVNVAWGYDLVCCSPCLSAADKEKIETRFLREIVKTIRRNDAGISNWQSWHNAGMAAIGFCLQDEEIASHAIDGKSGLRFQFAHSILPDGFWHEGATSYHYYALMAIRWAAEAAHAAGIDVYDNAAHKSLYEAPITYVFPDLRFPAVNDSNVFSITGEHHLYELAYARFKDPTFLIVAAHGKRNSLEALLWGVEELPPTPKLVLESKDFKGLGAVVLRQGAGKDQMYLHMDYGQHGGGHGHPDKLAIILFALGKHLAPDPSRLAYAAPLHKSWYRQTFAHNTVTIDQKSQHPAEGTLTFFHSQPGLAVAEAQCDTAYPNVAMKRTVAMTDAYLIDVFEVTGDQTHTIDWTYHNFGELKPNLTVSPQPEPLGKDNGYQHLTDVRQAQTDDTWSADFVQPGANVRLTMLGQTGTTLHFGMAMSENPPQPCPMVAVRRHAKQTTFVSVIEPYRNSPSVSGVRILSPATDNAALAIEIARGEDRDVFLLAGPAGVELEVAGVKKRSRASLDRVRGGKHSRIVAAN